MSDILTAAQSDDRRATLIAMRDKLAMDMDDAPPAVVAQIAGRLAAILEDIDGLGEPGKVSTLDELDKRRQDRRSTSDGDAPAGRSKRQRRG